MLWASPRQDRGVLHTAGFPKVGPGGLTHCRLLQGGTGRSYTLWASPRRDLGSPTCCGLSQGRTWGVLHTAGFYKVGLGGLTHFRLLQGGTGGSYTLWASPRQDLGGGLHTAGFPKVGPGGSYRLWASPRRDLGVSRVLSGPSGSEKPRPLGCTSMASKLHSEIGRASCRERV